MAARAPRMPTEDVLAAILLYGVLYAIVPLCLALVA